jgi:hypothetical protein
MTVESMRGITELDWCMYNIFLDFVAFRCDFLYV